MLKHTRKKNEKVKQIEKVVASCTSNYKLIPTNWLYFFIFKEFTFKFLNNFNILSQIVVTLVLAFFNENRIFMEKNR